MRAALPRNMPTIPARATRTSSALEGQSYGKARPDWWLLRGMRRLVSRAWWLLASAHTDPAPSYQLHPRSALIFSNSSASARSFRRSDSFLQRMRSWYDMTGNETPSCDICLARAKTSADESPLRCVSRSIRLGSTPRWIAMLSNSKHVSGIPADPNPKSFRAIIVRFALSVEGTMRMSMSCVVLTYP